MKERAIRWTSSPASLSIRLGGRRASDVFIGDILLQFPSARVPAQTSRVSIDTRPRDALIEQIRLTDRAEAATRPFAAEATQAHFDS
jgi:hypothetical protein